MPPNKRALIFAKEIPLKLKSHIDPHTSIVGDFSTRLAPKDRSFKQKLNREMLELTDVPNEIEITGIYRTFHPNTKEYTD